MLLRRHKDYKWFGGSDCVFKLSNGSHVEQRCSKLSGAERRNISALFSQAARRWWDSVVLETTSFTKPVFQIGWRGMLASNIEGSGAIALSRGTINVTSVATFKGLGYVCYSVNVSCTCSLYQHTVACITAVQLPRSSHVLHLQCTSIAQSYLNCNS